MKYLRTALLFLTTGLCLPLLANTGDFENRIREAETAGDRQRVAAICKEWYTSGQYSAGLLNWNYNALMSVEPDALLFTQQESDTYPALLLQYALNVRPDVRVLSFQLLETPQYRARVIGLEGLDWIPKDCSLSDFLTQVLRPQLSGSSAIKPVYFGSMTNRNLLLADREKLYLTGLALKFSPQSFDNVAALRYNFENRFRTDYLELSFEPEADPAAIARINLNYLPALLLLHRHYTAAGETLKAERAQNLAMRLARAGGREAELRAFFAPEPPENGIVSGISPKSLEKNMKKISERLYASEIETTNSQYEAFLTDLVKNKEFEQLGLCKTVRTDWVSLLPRELQSLPSGQLFKYAHPDDPDCPVQNITHEAAQRYCAWMTQVYNASPEKKKFKKVVFRLPTETEWVAAASGGKQEAVYPWPGNTVQTAKGCYLGNYYTLKPCGNCPNQTAPALASVGSSLADLDVAGEQDTPVDTSAKALDDANDGGFFPVPAASYYPNKLGLYAVSGNVAEMLVEPGKTKGGSWQDDASQGRIAHSKTSELPSPAVGFRVFMEVIEE